MKTRIVRYLSLAALVSPLMLSGCGDNDGVPVPTPGPTQTSGPPGPTRTPTAPAPTRTPTHPAATATPTSPPPPATATPTSQVPPSSTPTQATAATPTPTPTSEAATPTPTTPAGGPGIQIGTVSTTPGQQVSVSATLATGGGAVAGTQNDFTFATAENRKVTVVRKANGRPDCAVNPEINKGSTTFAFQPPSCTADTCTAVRAIVFSSEDVEPIADGSILYTCKVQVASDAPAATYPLTISGTILSTPTGGRVCGPAAGNPPCTGDQSGAVVVN